MTDQSNRSASLLIAVVRDHWRPEWSDNVESFQRQVKAVIAARDRQSICDEFRALVGLKEQLPHLAQEEVAQILKLVVDEVSHRSLFSQLRAKGVEYFAEMVGKHKLRLDQRVANMWFVRAEAEAVTMYMSRLVTILLSLPNFVGVSIPTPFLKTLLGRIAYLHRVNPDGLRNATNLVSRAVYGLREGVQLDPEGVVIVRAVEEEWFGDRRYARQLWKIAGRRDRWSQERLKREAQAVLAEVDRSLKPSEAASMFQRLTEVTNDLTVLRELVGELSVRCQDARVWRSELLLPVHLTWMLIAWDMSCYCPGPVVATEVLEVLEGMIGTMDVGTLGRAILSLARIRELPIRGEVVAAAMKRVAAMQLGACDIDEIQPILDSVRLLLASELTDEVGRAALQGARSRLRTRWPV